MAQGSGRPLEELPVELLQAILAAAPDIKTLKAAVMTGPCLYNAFKGAEEFIVRPVILRQFDTDLLHDVLAAHVSSKLDMSSNDHCKYKLVERFMVPYHTRDHEYFYDFTEWKLSQALLIDRLDEAVQYFVERMATDALHVPSASGSDTPSPVLPLSKTERSRISRSLYRFHTYCTLQTGWSFVIAWSRFFAPWENEQLYCIYQYLMDVVTRVLEDPNLLSNWPQHVHEGKAFINHIQFHVSLGLPHVRRLAIHNERHLQQVVRVISETSSDDICLNFLQKDEYLAPQSQSWEGRLKYFNSEDEVRHIPRPWYHDPDSGPEDIWRWAYQEEEVRGFVGSGQQGPLQQWVYVMWDRWRIDEWCVLVKPWLTSSRRWELYMMRQLEEQPRAIDLSPQMRERLLVRRRRLGLEPNLDHWKDGFLELSF
ncbi:hypothetical protein BO83DRAFT_414253 [Aspergillus eucalypticola CBS 122712]|uniref:Uncharacterized protein n=1 Tax=Aspergillus eucalypticola (strain CBS 122712 / IBT 29274) TaxID=1448314 RepID=A0A317WC53_ASPEC|nr:uncharacterized protein BO83DRAFT_414253 [Aspergillus eucalypticola CBS 122712]PWY82772.1 hypothetical protein BO83DRAFT_414253 [Aspergillus eucalypticola CBS 122712]